MLDALLTLVNDEYLENGARESERADGIKPIFRFFTIGHGSTREQEKDFWILERVFWIES